MIQNFHQQQPHIQGWVADSAEVIGNVVVEEDASVFFQSVIRGDNDSIKIGKGSNIQDGCVLHTDNGHALMIGERVTIGHRCILHGCHIEDDVLIGMGSIIMNGAHIGKHSIIGAGSLIPENTVIPSNSVAFGSPAKKRKDINATQIEMIKESAQHYIALAKHYQEETK